MIPKVSILKEYWLQNQDKILTLNIVSKILYDSDCLSNRKKAKPHVLFAKNQIEKALNGYVYEIRDGDNRRRVLGYKIATTSDEKEMYLRDLEKRESESKTSHEKVVIGVNNLTKKHLPLTGQENKQLPDNQ